MLLPAMLCELMFDKLFANMQNRLLTYTWPAVKSPNITVITEALSKSIAV